MDRREWDARYAGDELLWRAEPNRFLVSEVAGLPPGRALDVACGKGRNAVWLASRGWEVTGVDFSPVALSEAERLAAEHDLAVEWGNADVFDWEPPAGRLDLNVIFYLHLPAEQRRRPGRSHDRAGRAGPPRGQHGCRRDRSHRRARPRQPGRER